MTLEEVKANVSIESVLASHGARMYRNGTSLCLFHDDHAPSMKIYPKTNSFYCWACGKSGSVIDIEMELSGVDFHQAFLNLGGTPAGAPRSREQIEHEQTRKRLLDEKRRKETEAEDFQRKLFNEMKLNRSIVNDIGLVDPNGMYNNAAVIAYNRLQYLEYVYDDMNGYEIRPGAKKEVICYD